MKYINIQRNKAEKITQEACLEESWKLQPAEPHKYIVKNPEMLLQPLNQSYDLQPVFDYLNKRYW